MISLTIEFNSYRDNLFTLNIELGILNFMNTITWYLAPLELPLSYSSKANHKVQSSKFKVPRLLNRFSRLISFPEIRHTVSEDIIGMLLVIACQFYELDDLLGSLARQRLPEASHHAGYQRR